MWDNKTCYMEYTLLRVGVWEQGAGVTALKVNGNRFYVLKLGKEYWIYASEEDVMKDLVEKIRLNDDLGSEDVKVVKVSILKRDWRLQEVPWSKAILDLARTARKGEA
jgi:hypothetical protein